MGKISSLEICEFVTCNDALGVVRLQPAADIIVLAKAWPSASGQLFPLTINSENSPASETMRADLLSLDIITPDFSFLGNRDRMDVHVQYERLGGIFYLEVDSCGALGYVVSV